jgi:hypothetical protein
MPPIPERWRDVVGYEGLYKVSDRGKILSVPRVVKSKGGNGWQRVRGGILNPTIKTNGYPRLILCKNGKQKVTYVHQLVLEAFVGPCPEGMLCRHFPDPTPTNNTLRNLSWGTPKENNHDKIIHGTSGKGISKGRGEKNNLAKLTDDDVREIRRLYKCGGYSQDAIAKKFNVVQTTVSMIVRCKGWKHVVT